MSMGYISKMDDYNKASQSFVISDGVLLKYSGNDTIVNIPSSVVRIAANAFESRLDVIEITIPDSVKDIESFAEKLKDLYPDTVYVNQLMTHSWGQKVIRFYDPDGNLIEVGTPA